MSGALDQAVQALMAAANTLESAQAHPGMAKDSLGNVIASMTQLMNDCDVAIGQMSLAGGDALSGIRGKVEAVKNEAQTIQQKATAVQSDLDSGLLGNLVGAAQDLIQMAQNLHNM